MFRHRRQLRHWAARMLLLWLFGLGAGVANGCLASRGDVPCEGHRQAEHSIAVDHPQAPAKTNCQDFCEKSSISVPSLKTALDDAGGPALRPRPIAVARLSIAPTVDRSWGPRRDGARPPPIAIAFLRLTL